MDLAIAFPHIVCLMTQHHLTACASVQSFIFVMCTRNTELINIKESIKYSKKKIFDRIFENTSTFHDTFLFVVTVTLFSRNFSLKMTLCVLCFYLISYVAPQSISRFKVYRHDAFCSFNIFLMAFQVFSSIKWNTIAGPMLITFFCCFDRFDGFFCSCFFYVIACYVRWMHQFCVHLIYFLFPLVSFHFFCLTDLCCSMIHSMCLVDCVAVNNVKLSFT